MSQANDQKRYDELQLKCKECTAWYEREKIPFNPHACTSYCETGAELHRLGVKLSDAEKAWDKCNWTDSRYKQFYKG